MKHKDHSWIWAMGWAMLFLSAWLLFSGCVALSTTWRIAVDDSLPESRVIQSREQMDLAQRVEVETDKAESWLQMAVWNQLVALPLFFFDAVWRREAKKYCKTIWAPESKTDPKQTRVYGGIQNLALGDQFFSYGCYSTEPLNFIKATNLCRNVFRRKLEVNRPMEHVVVCGVRLDREIT
jgi:hypothetical protein